jgi:hypothetical protein
LSEQHAPWASNVEVDKIEILDDNGHVICDWDLRGRSKPPSDKHLARIVACVNACAGLVPKQIKILVAACEIWEEARATVTGTKLSQAEHSLAIRLAWVKGEEWGL